MKVIYNNDSNNVFQIMLSEKADMVVQKNVSKEKLYINMGNMSSYSFDIIYNIKTINDTPLKYKENYGGIGIKTIHTKWTPPFRNNHSLDMSNIISADVIFLETYYRHALTCGEYELDDFFDENELFTIIQKITDTFHENRKFINR